MAEFIGSTISLISKRDIRYVGTLDEISSENATVTLKDVRSWGTEGRKPGEEVGPNPTVYELIVFKGSDVKDLRIEEGPTAPEPPKPQMPDDPAIIESTRKSTPGGNAPQPTHSTGPQNDQNQQHGRGPPFPPGGPNQRSPFPQMPYPPYGFPPPDQRFGPHGFPPGPPGPPGSYGMPYGAPPPWYGPGGPGRFGGPPNMPPGQFPQQQVPIGPPGHQRMPNQPPPGAPTGPSADKKPAGAGNQVQPSSSAATPNPSPGLKGPAPPTETKPDVESALAPPASIQDQLDGQGGSAPAKSNKIVPAVPLPTAAKSAAAANGQAKAATIAAQGAAAGTAQTMAAKLTQSLQQPQIPNQPKKSLEDANRDARAAVAQAMAKLGAGKKADVPIADNTTQQVQTNGGHGGRRSSQTRGGRGNRHREPAKKMEVPKDDFDFESSNAKFNKQDLVKEAIATGSPLSSPVDGTAPSEFTASSASQNTGYNKTSSFFDNISSEIKERSEGIQEQVGGREFRSEERRKNMETFGQGSVDSGYRYRGRGRGRGGFRGRGRGRGGGGGMRGGNGAVVTEG